MEANRYSRISSATVIEIANALENHFGATFARPTKRHVALFAARIWPELYGRRREFVLQQVARSLNITVQYQ